MKILENEVDSKKLIKYRVMHEKLEIYLDEIFSTAISIFLKHGLDTSQEN